MTYYSADTVYCLIFACHFGTSLIYIMIVFTQIFLFGAYVEAFSLHLHFSSNAYPFICPDKCLVCEQTHYNFMGRFGWVLLFIATVIYQTRDLEMGVVQISRGLMLVDFRSILSGFVMLSITTLAILIFLIFNSATVEKSVDLITKCSDFFC